MQLSLFRTGPLAEALRALLPEVPHADAPAVLADLIDLRGGVELAERLDHGLSVPPPVEPAIRAARAEALRARFTYEVNEIQARLDEALAHAHKPRYRLPTAARAFQVLSQAGALETRKGAPLKTALRTVLAPYSEFLDTHLKRARFALRDLRTQMVPDFAGLGGEGAALAALEEALTRALQPRIEDLYRRAARAVEEHLAASLTAVVQALPPTPTEADLAPAFHPKTGAVSMTFAQAAALTAATFAHERRWLEGLIEAATGRDHGGSR